MIVSLLATIFFFCVRWKSIPVEQHPIPILQVKETDGNLAGVRLATIDISKILQQFYFGQMKELISTSF